MSFGEAVRSVFTNYAKFDGRATRSEYWWFQLFNVLVVLAGYAVLIAGYAAGRSTVLVSLALVALVIYSIATFIPGLAVTVRRLHDTDRSGWWLLIVLVPYVGAIVLFVFLVLPSSPGINQFGAPYGMLGDIRRVYYRGSSPQDTWTRYTDDAQRATADGYHPVSQQWKRDAMGDYLEVVYTNVQQGWQGAGWQTPTWQQAPAPGWQAPPAGPASASGQGGQHPFDGPPPPDRSGG